jgi:hypothetical protein
MTVAELLRQVKARGLDPEAVEIIDDDGWPIRLDVVANANGLGPFAVADWEDDDVDV